MFVFYHDLQYFSSHNFSNIFPNWWECRERISRLLLADEILEWSFCGGFGLARIFGEPISWRMALDWVGYLGRLYTGGWLWIGIWFWHFGIFGS